MNTITPVTIGNRKVGPGEPTFIITEVSGNHHQNYAEAEAIIRAAAKAGSDAIKLQTYTADTMTIDSDKEWFFLGGKDTPPSWKEQNLYNLYGTAYTPWEWQPKLKELTESLGMVFFSTPFDETAVDFLESIDVPCYKVASYEATDLPLLKKIASTGKPVIISIGFASLLEVEEAISTLRHAGVKDVIVLHCVTAYSGEPNPSLFNLSTISDIAKRFDVVAGFSDNNAGIDFPIMAVAAGASAIEKHVTLRRSEGGPDARFSLEPNELAEMVQGIRNVEKLMGTPHYGPASEDEEQYKTLRRSIFVVADIKKGDVFTKENIRVIRPAYGLAPRYYEEVLGKRATQDIERGDPLTEHMVTT